MQNPVLTSFSAFWATLGSLPWIIFAFTNTSFYPGLLHRDLMVYGFLGHLMAALWVKGKGHGQTSIVIHGGVSLLQALGLWFGLDWLLAASTLALLSYAFGVSLQCSQSRPSITIRTITWLFFLLLVAGSLLQEQGNPSFRDFYRLLLFKGSFIVFLFNGLPWINRSLSRPLTRLEEPITGLFFLLILAATGLTHMQGSSAARTASAFMLTGFVYYFTYGMRPPKGEGNARRFWTAVALSSTALGLCLSQIWTAYETHLMHLTYISGIGLMTWVCFLAPTREVLSHRFIHSFAATLMVASLTRSTAVFVKGSFERHLAYSSLLWIIAIWLWYYKTYRGKSKHQPPE